VEALRREFKGMYWLEVMLLHGYTSLPPQIPQLTALVRRIGPDKVQLNTAVRPPAEACAMAVPPERLWESAREFQPRAEVIEEYRGHATTAESEASGEAILALLRRHPCTEQDLAHGLAMRPIEVAKHLALLESKGQAASQRRGGLVYFHASVDFAVVEECQRQGRWKEAERFLVNAAQSVERAGADFLLICTNTMHKLADEVQAGICIPLLHIADATAVSVQRAGVRRVGLLGTRFTMEEDFYGGRLRQWHGLPVLIPDAGDRAAVHRMIYDELCVGRVCPDSRTELAAITNRLVEAGAEGIILGCTELGLLVQADDCRVPLFDTPREHALAAVELALARR
jgi:aspartate racemase